MAPRTKNFIGDAAQDDQTQQGDVVLSGTAEAIPSPGKTLTEHITEGISVLRIDGDHAGIGQMEMLHVHVGEFMAGIRKFEGSATASEEMQVVIDKIKSLL